MRYNLFPLIICSVFFTPIFFLSLHIAGAQVMTSSNYQIQSDSLNAGGGISSSTSYLLESTVGETGTGDLDSANYALGAGYQEMQEVYIAMTVSTSSVLLSPSIPGITGGTSNGSVSVTVTTDSVSGYQLTIKSEGDPALQKGVDTIADYSPVGNPDYTFTTATTDAHFGYTPEGVDVVQRFLNSGTVCNAGLSNDSLSCWDGLSTLAVPIAVSSGSNHPSGAQTDVHFRVGVGNSVAQSPGVYTATTTLTALPL